MGFKTNAAYQTYKNRKKKQFLQNKQRISGYIKKSSLSYKTEAAFRITQGIKSDYQLSTISSSS